MISVSNTYARIFQIGLLAAFVVFAAGLALPATVHALPPEPVGVGDGDGDGVGDGSGSGSGGAATPTASLIATPSSVQQGYASQLSYSSSNVTSCSINNGVGSVTANANDYRSVSPSSTVTYTLTCQTSSGSTVSASRTVTVTPDPAPLNAYCDATPDTVQINETVTWGMTHSTGASSGLVWQRGNTGITKICTGGQNYTELNNDCPDDIRQGLSCPVEGKHCRMSAGCDGNTFVDGEGQSNAHTTYGSVTRYTCVASSGGTATYTYGWTGTDGLTGTAQNVSKAYSAAGEKTGRATVTRSTGGSASATCTANVSPKTPTASLTANPSSIINGSSSTLSWTSTNANACTLNEGIGSVSTAGTRSVSPGSTTTYTLMCTTPSSGSTAGTWQYYGSDISDFSCPVTDTNKAYSSTPNCPSNPQGKACTTGSGMSVCKINTVNACNIHTDLYECQGSASSPSQVATASATVTVSAQTLPDLTAGAITPTTATRGQAQTISGAITNIGNAAAGASSGYFQLTAPSAKNSTTASVSIPAISSGGSSPSSFSYSFPTSGTHTVRLCADWFGQVAESNEGNNCGPWTDIVVTGEPIPSSVSCTVSPQSVVVGGSVTYNTSTVGAATAPYGWTASDGTTYGSGSTVTRSFPTAGSYDMNVTATNASNNPAICPRVTVTSPAACTGTVTATLTANPSRVRTGSQTTLTWNATGVNTSCTVSGTDGFTQTTTATTCSVPTTVVTRPISNQSTYSISCDGGPVLKSITVNVIPTFQEF